MDYPPSPVRMEREADSTGTQPARRRSAGLARLSPFNGTMPLSAFLAQVELCRRHNIWTDDNCCMYVSTNLQGRAAEVLMVHGCRAWTWTQMLAALEQRFRAEGSPNAIALS